MLGRQIAGGGTLATTYFSNEMLARQSQGEVTNAGKLDAAGRPREVVTGSEGGESVEAFHCAGGTDSPAWTETEAGWTRNIAGSGGELDAIKEGGGEPVLQLTDLHGDVVATAPLGSRSSGTD